MQKTNLLYIITKLELGGAQKQLLSLIERLDKDKFNIFLFTARQGLLSEDALSINGLTIEKSTCLERSINPFCDFLALIEIYRFIKKNNIHIVHTHSSKAGILGRWAARLARRKVILHTVHGWSFNDYQPFFVRQFFIFLERITARFTNKLIVVSNYDRQKGLDNHIGNNGKYTLIRYGVDYARFCVKEKNIRRVLGIGNDDLIVGTVSCLKPQKSPLDYVRLAFLVTQSIPDVKFILAGDGVLRDAVEKLIRNLNLESKFILLGWCLDIPEILQALDVFVLTSLWEGLPISVLEAMASSKPVLVTNTGGVGEVVKDGQTGFLVEARDLDNMAKRLIALLGDMALRNIIGQNARDSLSQDFAVLNMLKKTQELYSSLS